MMMGVRLTLQRAQRLLCAAHVARLQVAADLAQRLGEGIVLPAGSIARQVLAERGVSGLRRLQVAGLQRRGQRAEALLESRDLLAVRRCLIGGRRCRASRNGHEFLQILGAMRSIENWCCR